jgi:hypothetical protein
VTSGLQNRSFSVCAAERRLALDHRQCNCDNLDEVSMFRTLRNWLTRPRRPARPQTVSPDRGPSPPAQPQAAPPYRVFTRESDLTLSAEKLDETLGPLPAAFEAEMTDAKSAFPSVSERPEGPRVLVRYRGPALILTAEVEDIASAALEDAIRRRAPDIAFRAEPPAEPTKPGQRPTALGSYPEAIKAFESGRTPLLCGVSYIPGINLDGMDKASYVTSSWWWPETRAVVARTKAHAVTVVLGGLDKTPAKERILVEMQLVAAALDVLKSATAVVWPDANAMWQPDLFRSELDRAKGEIPLTLAVAVKLGRDTEHLHPDGKPKWFARTEGLNAFGMMEVEWRAFGGEVRDLVQWMQGIVWYLVNKGPIIADGESMGSDTPGFMPPIILRHESSTTVLGSRAYAVYPQPIN